MAIRPNAAIASRIVAVASILLASPGAAPANYPESLLARSRAAEKSGNKLVAERLAQSAIVSDPLQASSYVGLADLYMREGHADFAGFYYAKALEIDPQNKEARRGLEAADHASAERTAQAEHSLDKEKGSH
jgi:tetratricopeptide (TPR) repeat protein